MARRVDVGLEPDPPEPIEPVVEIRADAEPSIGDTPPPAPARKSKQSTAKKSTGKKSTGKKDPEPETVADVLTSQLAAHYQSGHEVLAGVTGDPKWKISNQEAFSVAAPAVEVAQDRGWLDRMDDAPMLRLASAVAAVELPRILAPLIAKLAPIINAIMKRKKTNPIVAQVLQSAALNEAGEVEFDAGLWAQLSAEEQAQVTAFAADYFSKTGAGNNHG